MRRILGLALLSAGVLVFSVGTPLAGAGTKFNSTQVIDDNGHLVFDFEERGLKKFTAVDYRLDATASAMTCDATGEQCLAQRFDSTVTTSGLVPGDKGLVAATLVLSDVHFPTGVPCTCGSRRVDYYDMTLTTLTTGDVYSLDPISRDFP